eukprot:UN20180
MNGNVNITFVYVPVMEGRIPRPRARPREGRTLVALDKLSSTEVGDVMDDLEDVVAYRFRFGFLGFTDSQNEKLTNLFQDLTSALKRQLYPHNHIIFCSGFGNLHLFEVIFRCRYEAESRSGYPEM